MSKRKIVHARVDREIYNKLRIRFPEVDHSELYKIMYNTSLISLESGARQMRFGDKIGEVYKKNAKKKK